MCFLTPSKHFSSAAGSVCGMRLLCCPLWASEFLRLNREKTGSGHLALVSLKLFSYFFSGQTPCTWLFPQNSVVIPLLCWDCNLEPGCELQAQYHSGPGRLVEGQWGSASPTHHGHCYERLPGLRIQWQLPCLSSELGNLALVTSWAT